MDYEEKMHLLLMAMSEAIEKVPVIEDEEFSLDLGVFLIAARIAFADGWTVDELFKLLASEGNAYMKDSFANQPLIHPAPTSIN
jgi:hypothetical protein